MFVILRLHLLMIWEIMATWSIKLRKVFFSYSFYVSYKDFDLNHGMGKLIMEIFMTKEQNTECDNLNNWDFQVSSVRIWDFQGR